jgi:hypothetical protein
MIREDSTTANEPRASARLILVQRFAELQRLSADEAIAAYVTHSRPQPRLVTISREVARNRRPRIDRHNGVYEE